MSELNEDLTFDAAVRWTLSPTGAATNVLVSTNDRSIARDLAYCVRREIAATSFPASSRQAQVGLELSLHLGPFTDWPEVEIQVNTSREGPVRLIDAESGRVLCLGRCGRVLRLAPQRRLLLEGREDLLHARTVGSADFISRSVDSPLTSGAFVFSEAPNNPAIWGPGAGLIGLAAVGLVALIVEGIFALGLVFSGGGAIGYSQGSPVPDWVGTAAIVSALAIPIGGISGAILIAVGVMPTASLTPAPSHGLRAPATPVKAEAPARSRTADASARPSHRVLAGFLSPTETGDLVLMSKTDFVWTQCELRFPPNRVYRFPADYALVPNAKVRILARDVREDPREPDPQVERGSWALVRCAEGVSYLPYDRDKAE